MVNGVICSINQNHSVLQIYNRIKNSKLAAIECGVDGGGSGRINTPGIRDAKKMAMK